MAAVELAQTLLTKIADEGHHSSAKVTVVGTGQVGMAAAFAMMTQVRLHFSPYCRSYAQTFTVRIFLTL